MERLFLIGREKPHVKMLFDGLDPASHLPGGFYCTTIVPLFYVQSLINMTFSLENTLSLGFTRLLPIWEMTNQFLNNNLNGQGKGQIKWLNGKYPSSKRVVCSSATVCRAQMLEETSYSRDIQVQSVIFHCFSSLTPFTGIGNTSKVQDLAILFFL